MENYKLSVGEGAENSRDCPLKRYPIKSNGPIDYEIPEAAKFYRIERNLENDAFFLELYEERCRNCREIPRVREKSGKASILEIRLKKSSAVLMEKKWKFC